MVVKRVTVNVLYIIGTILAIDAKINIANGICIVVSAVMLSLGLYLAIESIGKYLSDGMFLFVSVNNVISLVIAVATIITKNTTLALVNAILCSLTYFVMLVYRKEKVVE